MPNEPLGGRAEGLISKGIQDQTALAKRKRREAVERLADYGQALVDNDPNAARSAMDALVRVAREASEAERRVREHQGVLNTAKAHSADLGSWRDIVNTGHFPPK